MPSCRVAKSIRPVMACARNPAARKRLANITAMSFVEQKAEVRQNERKRKAKDGRHTISIYMGWRWADAMVV